MKKIFLGGLPKSVTDEKLRDLFCHYGEIIDFVVMKDPQTKDSRGFGFIEFVNEDPVNEILKTRPHIIENREIEVRRAMPKDITHNTIHERTKRVFIGGLNYDVTDDMLLNYYSDKFSRYGKVESAEVKRDRDTNTSRGFGFITFDTEDAVDSVLIMEPKPAQFGRNCEVKKSEPRRADDSGSHRRRGRSDRRRSPMEQRARRHDDEYYGYSPPQDHYRHSRSSRYPREPYPGHSYARGNSYGRSPPYRRYRNDSPAMYPEPPSYDRSYSYSYYSECPNDYSNQSLDNSNNPYARSGGVRTPVNNNQTIRSINPPFTPRTSIPYRQFEPGYRDHETNPY